MQSLLTLDFSRLPEAVRHRHTAYVSRMQRSDGGFPGRRGASDVYYTAFALRNLAMLDALSPEIARPAARFLAQRLDRKASGADFFSLVTSVMLVESAAGEDPLAGCDRRQLVADFVRPLRRPDGGYAKTERGTSSTYQTFLVALCMQLVGLGLDDPEAIVRMVRARQRDDGGFVEVDALTRSGVNPTAAAVNLLRMCDALDDATRASTGRFLLAMQTAEGGFQAHTQMPVADLLSTFTGLLTLADLGILASSDSAAARRFALAMERSGGGFHAGAWDDDADVEYTFYGLGTLALLGESA